MKAAPDYIADGYILPAGPLSARLEQFRRICQDRKILYPLVLKPNLGQGGSGFKLISSQADAQKYLSQVTADVIVQRYISHEKEIGVFYYRIPGQQHGHIFAVTQKLFPTLIGDGASTLEQLLQKDERASLMASTYLNRFPQLRHEVPRSGVRLRLSAATISDSRATKISKTADLRLSNSMVLHRKPRTSTMRETRCSRHIGPSTNNGTWFSGSVAPIVIAATSLLPRSMCSEMRNSMPRFRSAILRRTDTCVQ
jgi:ATP-grasp domain